MSLYSIKDILRLHIREGLSIRRYLPPPIPFVIQYNDQAGKISKFVKNFYEEIRTKYFCGYFSMYNLVTAFKNNKNLKAYLVNAKLWTILYITEPVSTLFCMQKRMSSLLRLKHSILKQIKLLQDLFIYIN